MYFNPNANAYDYGHGNDYIFVNPDIHVDHVTYNYRDLHAHTLTKQLANCNTNHIIHVHTLLHSEPDSDPDPHSHTDADTNADTNAFVLVHFHLHEHVHCESNVVTSHNPTNRDSQSNNNKNLLWQSSNYDRHEVNANIRVHRHAIIHADG
jgi:tRNA G37 N-methylase Trm5